jgi:hypothetical protein
VAIFAYLLLIIFGTYYGAFLSFFIYGYSAADLLHATRERRDIVTLDKLVIFFVFLLFTVTGRWFVEI